MARSHTFSTGTAIYFEDGFDFIWVPTSLRTPYDSADVELVASWQQLNDGRQQVIAAAKHHAADHRCVLTFQPWGMVAAARGSMTFDFSVARNLTWLLQRLSAEEALVEFFRDLWDLQIASKESARALLARAAANPDPAPAPTVEENPLGDSLTMLFSAVPCSMSDDSGCDVEALLQTTAERLESANAAFVDELRRRLPPDSLSIHIEKPGLLQLDYPDREDSLGIAPHGKRTSRLLESHGISGLADRIMERYQQLGQKRGQALGALDHLLASVGLASDSSFSGRGRAYGHVHREVFFDTRRALTVALSSREVEDVLRRWWAGEETGGRLPAVSHEIWAQALSQPYLKPERRSLLSRPAQECDGLPVLAPEEMKRADERAAKLIREFRHLVEAGDLSLLGWWQQPWCYHRGHDTWVDESWWLKVARCHWQQSQDQGAAVILLAHGDDTPRAAILDEMRGLDAYCSESFDPPLVWQLWNELPWRVPDESRPAYLFSLGSPPPEHAWRLTQITRSDLCQQAADGTELPEVYLSQLPRAAAIEWLGTDEIQQLHDCCHTLAAAAQSGVMLDEDMLLTAQNMGWPHLADILSENPLTLPSLREWESSWSMPSGAWAARISAVRPTSFSARLALSLLLRPSEEIAQEITRRVLEMEDVFVKTIPDLPPRTTADVAQAQAMEHRAWLEALIMAAIAWQRWRTTPTNSSAPSPKA